MALFGLLTHTHTNPLLPDSIEPMVDPQSGQDSVKALGKFAGGCSKTSDQ